MVSGIDAFRTVPIAERSASARRVNYGANGFDRRVSINGSIGWRAVIIIRLMSVVLGCGAGLCGTTRIIDDAFVGRENRVVSNLTLTP